MTSTHMPPVRRRRQLLLQSAVLAVLLALVAVAIADLIPGSGSRLEHAAPGWVAVEVLLESLALAAYAVLFHGVFSRGRYRLAYVRSAQISIGELGAFAVVPAGAGGPAVRIWGLIRSGMPFAVLMRRSVIHGAIFNLPYIAAAVALGVIAALGLGVGQAPLAVALAPIGVVAVAVVLASLATIAARNHHGGEQTRWRRIGWEVIEAVPGGLRELPGNLRRPLLLLSAAGYWAGDCGVLIAAFHAVHGSAPIGVIVLAYLLGQLGSTLPLPGGVGGVEPIMLGVLTASGVDLGLGAAAILLYRLVSLGLQTVAGAVAVATLVPALQRSPHPSAD